MWFWSTRLPAAVFCAKSMTSRLCRQKNEPVVYVPTAHLLRMDQEPTFLGVRLWRTIWAARAPVGLGGPHHSSAAMGSSQK